MHRLLSICLIVLCGVSLAVAEGQQQFANLGTCKVESGETIQDCKIGYRTWGTLNGQKSNVVVILTWFTGNTEMLSGLLGANNYVDTSKFYVVAIDALANGVSISPSNSEAQPRLKFPRITMADMVESQHRVLTESLGLKHVHAVIGGSMGGMQSFQWSVQYPDFMDLVIPWVGSTRLTPQDLMLWRGEKNAVLDSKIFDDGNYKAGAVIPEVADMHFLELTSPSHINSDMKLDGFEAEAQKVEADETFDPSNRVRQLEAMMSLDLSRKFGGDMEAAARSVKSRMLIIVAKHDHMVNPQPALDFAKILKIEPIVLQSDCGHLAPGCEANIVIPAVQKALAMQ
jgi:homoserine O-acetyltransferase